MTDVELYNALVDWDVNYVLINAAAWSGKLQELYNMIVEDIDNTFPESR